MKANLSWLTEHLATGGDLSFDPDEAIEQVADIQAQGVTLIIDLREEADDMALWRDLGMQYVYLPTTDAHGHHVPEGLFHFAVAAAKKEIENGGRVFVHCHMGVNRGPSAAYAILLDQGMGITEAFDLIVENRPQAGLAYAVDALKAHHVRLLSPRHQVSFSASMDLEMLEDHIDTVFTPEKRRSIQHIIRDGHLLDRQRVVQSRRRA